MKIFNNIISSFKRNSLPKRDSEEIKKARTEKMCNQIHSKVYLKKYNDFFIHDKKRTKISHTLFFDTKQMINDNIGMFPRRLFTRYCPDRVDAEKFWKYLYGHFPLHVATENEEIVSIEDAKLYNLNFASSIGAIGELVRVLYNTHTEIKMLEIGAGYGSVYDYLTKYSIIDPDNEYYNVELVKNFSHNNFFKTNGNGLPKELIDLNFQFDIAYCFNTMQHMSYKQRIAYYYGLYDKLKDGGRLVLGIHLETPANSNSFGLYDEFGTKYIKYFNQYTTVDKMETFYKDMEDAGFREVELIGSCDIYFVFRIKK